MRPIAIPDLSLKPFDTFNQGWYLLAAGDFAAGAWNCMTVSWGFLGTMWNKPVAQIVVRPQRHTREFLDRHPTFTLSQFGPEHRKALAVLGSKSGRDGDKVAEAGLTPVAASAVPAPTFAEAAQVFECRILFRQEMARDAFLEPSILAECYPGDDRHIAYIGEVVAAARR
ncbi:MAG: flavin reductase family protein [Kiritimatiellia bacterium]|jgi:flavin reductase (DIM6/NTAB) family NADH-FMN oxidoreductase RutF